MEQVRRLYIQSNKSADVCKKWGTRIRTPVADPCWTRNSKETPRLDQSSPTLDCWAVEMGDLFRWIGKSRQQSVAQVWRRTKTLKSRVKFPQSAMCWVGVGQLCFLKTTVNASVYQKDWQTAEDMFRDEDFTFQQDLAPALQFKDYQKVNAKKQDHRALMACQLARSQLHWELVGIVKRMLQKHQCSNLRQLKETIHEAWMSISSEECDRLMRFISARIEAAIDKKGAAATTYWPVNSVIIYCIEIVDCLFNYSYWLINKY